jgi:hypothetical protein
MAGVQRKALTVKGKYGRELLRKRCAVEIVHKDLHQGGAVEIRQTGNLSNDANVAEAFDGLTVFAVLIADQHNAVHRQFRRVQSRER